MAKRLIGEDCGISIVIGAAYDGSHDPSTAVTGTAANIKGIAKRVLLHSTIEKTNVKALGDANKQNRYHSGEQSLEIETFVPSTEGTFPITFDCVGKYCTINFLELAGTLVPYTGVIVEWSGEAPVASEQTRKITLDLNPDYLVMS